MAAAIDDVESRGWQDHLAARKFGNVAILLASAMEVFNLYLKSNWDGTVYHVEATLQEEQEIRSSNEVQREEQVTATQLGNFFGATFHSEATT